MKRGPKSAFRGVARTPKFKSLEKPPKPRRYQRKTDGPTNAGRPKLDIDWERVEKLARIHCTPEEIALHLEINESTLVKRREFPLVYKRGWQKGKESLRRCQFRVALKGNVTMLIWLGKQVLGQRDKHELTGADGGPVEIVNRPDFSKLSNEELVQLRDLVRKASAARQGQVVDITPQRKQLEPARNGK